MTNSRSFAAKTLWVVEFKPAPGNRQHIRSFIARAEENGFNVRAVLSRHLSPIASQFSNNVTLFAKSDTMLAIFVDTLLFFLYRWFILYRLLRRDRPKIILLANWHPINAAFCIIAKMAASSRTVVWLHEPYKSDKHLYGPKAMAFVAVEAVQSIALPWIDDVVVHSQTAMEAFKAKYHKAKNNMHVIPLQFQNRPGQASQRTLVSFLGKAAKAKGINVFFELIELSAAKGLDWQFGIATGDDISEHIKAMSTAARSKLKIVNPPDLSDEAIRQMATESLAVVCPYVSNMQSGLVPVAFMCGSPVVATDLKGLRESVQHKETGYLVDIPAQAATILDALDYIKEHFPRLSRQCLQEFLATYDDHNWRSAYGWLCED